MKILVTIPCKPNDTVYVITCEFFNKYIIKKFTIYAVIVKLNKILLTCNGTGYYQWTLNEDAFLCFEDAQKKIDTLNRNINTGDDTIENL